MGEQPAVIKAIDKTCRVLEKRIRLYRWLVLAVSAVGALSILSAAIFRQWLFFAGLILFVPLCGAFFLIDSRTVWRWRAEILEMSSSRGLDLPLFLKTAAELRRFSPSTLQGMLSAIPQNAWGIRIEEEQQQRKRERQIVSAAILLTAPLVCLAAAAYYHSLLLVLSGAGFALLFFILCRRSPR